MQQVFSLYELTHSIKEVLSECFTSYYWVRAEISNLSVAYNGHCYMELVQKSEDGKGFVAKAKANIWSSTFQPLKTKFEIGAGVRFAQGIGVLLQVSVSFHEVYGFALVVHDVDPTYTLGDMARRRKEILDRLRKEGLIDANKMLDLPLLPQRVAVISSATAAGYGDFCNQLFRNAQGYVFYTKLFPAVMQGDSVEQSVKAALMCVAEQYMNWDVVVIIRGGGAVSELSCFDSYELAQCIATFPLPVITGIGHERDTTVIDEVSHTRVKTPTAAAEFLINKVGESAVRLEEYALRLADSVKNRMEGEKHRLTLLAQKLPSLFAVLKAGQEYKLQNLMGCITAGLEKLLTAQRHKLELMEKSLEAANPKKILQRGYSITTVEGKVVKSVGGLKAGDRLTTEFADGCVESEIIKQ